MDKVLTFLAVMLVKAPNPRAYRRLNRLWTLLSAFAVAASVASAADADFVLKRESGALVLQWSDKYAGYRVQTSTLEDLPVVWSETSLVPVYSNGWYSVVLTNASGPKSFYRLAMGLSVRAREAGAALNCNPTTRTGTDDTAVLQRLLDEIDAAGGGTLILDGVALISDVLIKAEDNAQVADMARTQLAALMVGNNTTIQCEAGAGFFLADGSNCPMLSNKGVSGELNAPRNRNIRLVGGTWNGGGSHNAMRDRNSPFSYWNGVMYFAAFEGLTFDGVTVVDAPCLGIMLVNGGNVRATNHRATWPSNLGLIHDAFHCWGDLDNVTITNLYVENCGDDFISLNTDEGYASWLGTAPNFPWYTPNGPGLYWSFGQRRYPKSPTQGALTNFLIDGVTLVNCDFGFRVIYMARGNNLVDNITFRNVAGRGSTFSTAWCRINGPYDSNPLVDVRRFTIDNFSVPNRPSLILYGQDVTVKNCTWTNGLIIVSAVVAWGGTVTVDNCRIANPPRGEGAISLRGTLDHLVVRNCVFENCTPVFNAYGCTVGTVDKDTNNTFINSPWDATVGTTDYQLTMGNADNHE